MAPTAKPQPAWLLARLAERGIGSLLLEGGPTTNAAFLAAGLIDELYWTIGARLLGTGALPMIAPIPGGSPWAEHPREGQLVSIHRSGDELFLRYRFESARRVSASTWAAWEPGATSTRCRSTPPAPTRAASTSSATAPCGCPRRWAASRSRCSACSPPRLATIRIGTSIVSIWGHDAQTTRMAAMTLHEATGGRFVLGLGVSHLHLAQKLRGHTFERPLTRMREYLAAYRAAIYRGPMTSDGSEPPVLLAALRERMLALAATDADGAFPYLVTPERVAWTRGVLDAAAAAGARSDPGGVACRPCSRPIRSSPAPPPARTWRRTCAPPPTRPAGSPRDSARPIGSGRPATGSSMRWWPGATSRRSAPGSAELTAAGADHVAVIPVGPDGTTEHLPVLEALAATR